MIGGLDIDDVADLVVLDPQVDGRFQLVRILRFPGGQVKDFQRLVVVQQDRAWSLEDLAVAALAA